MKTADTIVERLIARAEVEETSPDLPEAAKDEVAEHRGDARTAERHSETGKARVEHAEADMAEHLAEMDQQELDEARAGLELAGVDPDLTEDAVEGLEAALAETDEVVRPYLLRGARDRITDLVDDAYSRGADREVEEAAD